MVLSTGPAFNPERDRRALHLVFLSAVVGIASAVISVGTTTLNTISPLLSTSTTSTGTTYSLGPAYEWWALILIGGALGVAWILLLRAGFAALAPIDRRFSSPATLGWLAIIGIVLALGGLALLFHSLQTAAGCVGTNNTTLANCFLSSGILASFGVLAVGGILALIGYIGLLIGVWRLGRRYGDDLFRIGAVLYIFPVLNLVGEILVLVAARKASARFGGGTPPAGVAR
jgi:Protein of unknown function (DUF973)